MTTKCICGRKAAARSLKGAQLKYPRHLSFNDVTLAALSFSGRGLRLRTDVYGVWLVDTAPRPDANADGRADRKATETNDATIDYGHSDVSHSDGTNGVSPV